MQLIVNKHADGILDNIVLPHGWEMTEHLPDNTNANDLQNIATVRSKIATYLPEIVTNLDRFIETLAYDYHIVVQESYISIDEEATFHINILVSEKDYHSPELIAAKIHTKEYIAAVGDVSSHVRFSVSAEYYKAYYTQRTFKLNYVFKNTYAA